MSDKPRSDTQQTIASANLSWNVGIGTIRSIVGWSNTSSVISDATMPGATQLTVMPRDATSSASERLAPCSPALAAA